MDSPIVVDVVVVVVKEVGCVLVVLSERLCVLIPRCKISSPVREVDNMYEGGRSPNRSSSSKALGPSEIP